MFFCVISPSQALFWICFWPEDTSVVSAASGLLVHDSSLKNFSSVNVLISFTSLVESVIPLLSLFIFKTSFTCSWRLILIERDLGNPFSPVFCFFVCVVFFSMWVHDLKSHNFDHFAAEITSYPRLTHSINTCIKEAESEVWCTSPSLY